MIRFAITTHEGCAGATLSLRGSWGNLPYADLAAAHAAAHAGAGDQPYTIEREHVGRAPRRK